jgi:hypothetical protein
MLAQPQGSLVVLQHCCLTKLDIAVELAVSQKKLL